MIALFSIPSPLHPAIVHFPIVLILLGSLIAVFAVFIQRWNLSVISAVLISLGAAGSVAATWSGDEDEEMVESGSPALEEILEEHEEWGERTRNAAILAAILGIGTVMIARKFPKIARGLSVATAVVAIGASYCVAETGHYGGLLVYRHGAGVNMAAESDNTAATSKARHEDDDDD